MTAETYEIRLGVRRLPDGDFWRSSSVIEALLKTADQYDAKDEPKIGDAFRGLASDLAPGIGGDLEKCAG